MSVNLTPGQARALHAMVDLVPREDGGHEWTSPRALAKALWPDSPGWKRRSHNSIMGVAMPLNAGKVLHQLHRHGLVRPHTRADGPLEANLWRPTILGYHVAENARRRERLAAAEALCREARHFHPDGACLVSLDAVGVER